MLSQNGLAKAIPLHRTVIGGSSGRRKARVGKPSVRNERALHDQAVRFIWGRQTAVIRPGRLRRIKNARCPEARLHLLRAQARSSRYVLCGEFEVRPINPKGAFADRRFIAPCGGRGSLYRQEWIDTRYRCAVGPQSAAAGRGRDRQGERAQASGYRPARRHRHGKGAQCRGGSDDLRRIRLGRAQGRSGRRSGTRRTAARLLVRPL